MGTVTVGLETMNGTPFAGSGCYVRNNRKDAVGGTSQDTSMLEKGSSGTVKTCLRNRMGDPQCS